MTPEEIATRADSWVNHWPTLSAPIENPELRVLSLGAGVQSSTLALMASRGDIGPKPDCAIFADTGWEPQGVYDWLDWLEPQLRYPVYRVGGKNLRDGIAAPRPTGQFLRVDIPAYVKNPDGKPGGLINRSCTQDYKIKPIERKVRELLGITGKRSPKSPVVEQWIGISSDELQRVKKSRHSWIHNRHPLIEANMSRRDCLTWMRDRQYPEPAKSSCIGCPFHSASEWARVLADPVQRDDAIEVDRRLRSSPASSYRTKGTLYLHRSLRPLDEVFDGMAEPENSDDLFGFNNECEGICGV